MMPRYFLEFDHAEYNIARFMDRFWSAYEWFGTWTMLKIVSNRHMRNALSPVVPRFDITRFYADSSMSFTDMPLSLYFPMATNNEVIKPIRVSMFSLLAQSSFLTRFFGFENDFDKMRVGFFEAN